MIQVEWNFNHANTIRPYRISIQKNKESDSYDMYTWFNKS